MISVSPSTFRSAASQVREKIRALSIRLRKRGGTAFGLEAHEDRSVLRRDGVPFYIKGVAGWHYHRLDLLAKIGGNSVRANPDLKGLNQAYSLGLSVLVNLPAKGEKDGFDWDDARAVQEQKETILNIVRRLKDHPAVMMWSVGNEIDYVPYKPTMSAPCHPHLWRHVNDLAKAIKEIDPIHPVSICTGMTLLEDKLPSIDRDCPDIDLLGINNFWQTGGCVGVLDRLWKRPYYFAEWGVNPPWYPPKTTWGASIEATSTQKAALISDRYGSIILNAAHCVGAFLFYWGERNEATHTWFGLFRDGLRTESIDVMERFWTGSWPVNRAPGILRLSIGGFAQNDDIRLSPNRTYEASVHCYDPESDDLQIAWEVRQNVYRSHSDYGGRAENHFGPIPGLLLSSESTVVRFVSPVACSAYRLFVQVTDGNGSAAYANLPFLVERASQQSAAASAPQ